MAVTAIQTHRGDRTAGINVIITITTADAVRARGAVDVIIARPTRHGVGARAIVQFIIAIAAIKTHCCGRAVGAQQIITIATTKTIGATIAIDGIIAKATFHRIGAIAGIKVIRAFAARIGISATLAIQRIRTVTAFKRVITAAAIQNIIAITARQRVITCVTRKPISAIVAKQHIIARIARQCLSHSRAQHRVIATAAPHLLNARQRVISAQPIIRASSHKINADPSRARVIRVIRDINASRTRQAVTAAIPAQHIIGRAPNERIGARASPHPLKARYCIRAIRAVIRDSGTKIHAGSCTRGGIINDVSSAGAAIQTIATGITADDIIQAIADNGIVA